MDAEGFAMDVGALPLVVTEYRNLTRASHFVELEAAFLELYARRERLCFLADLQSLDRPDAAARKRAAEMEAKLDESSRRYSIGNVMIVRSAIVRGALTAVRWFHAASAPEFYVSSYSEAADTIERLMRAENLLLPRVSQRLAAMRRQDARAHEKAG